MDWALQHGQWRSEWYVVPYENGKSWAVEQQPLRPARNYRERWLLLCFQTSRIHHDVPSILEAKLIIAWKLVLLPNSSKSLFDSLSYRLISLLDQARKILEQIIANRIEEVNEGTRGLSDCQYDFWKKLVTIDESWVIVDNARTAIECKRWRRGSKKYHDIVTLDARTGFHSANLYWILEAPRLMEIPE